MVEYAPFPDKPHRTVTRPAPALPATAMKTYQILAPVRSHFRKGTCEQVDCKNWKNGWVTKVPHGAAELIELITSGKTGRKYTEVTAIDAAEREFLFAPGQQCFKSGTHLVRLDRPEIFVARDGDWRGNPRGSEPYRFNRAADWVDSFANHQQTLADRLERG